MENFPNHKYWFPVSSVSLWCSSHSAITTYNMVGADCICIEQEINTSSTAGQPSHSSIIPHALGNLEKNALYLIELLICLENTLIRGNYFIWEEKVKLFFL